MDVATPVVQEFFDQYVRSRSAMDIDHIAERFGHIGWQRFHDAAALRLPPITVLDDEPTA